MTHFATIFELFPFNNIPCHLFRFVLSFQENCELLKKPQLVLCLALAPSSLSLVVLSERLYLHAEWRRFTANMGKNYFSLKTPPSTIPRFIDFLKPPLYRAISLRSHANCLYHVKAILLWSSVGPLNYPALFIRFSKFLHNDGKLLQKELSSALFTVGSETSKMKAYCLPGCFFCSGTSWRIST